MAITPPTYTPSGSLFGSATPSTPAYTYGNLGNTTSAYNLWGSTGNPYIVNGPSYTPGSGAPINPQPVAPLTPINNSGGDNSPIPDWIDPSLNSSSTSGLDDNGLQTWLGRNRDLTRVAGNLLGVPLLEPAVDFMYGVNPITQTSLDWYGGSTDFDNNVNTNQNLARNDYSGSLAAYQADKAAGMTTETWSERWSADKAEKAAADATAQPVGNWFNSLWSSPDAPASATTPVTFGNPNSALAQQATQLQASEAQRVATNIAMNNTKAEAARVAAENPAQAAADTAYVGSSDDGYAATAARHGTVPGSEQTAMLAEQDMGMSDSGGGSSDDGGGGWSGSDAASDMDADSGWSGADSDFSDSGGGDSGGGGGGSYIATAATNALGEEGLTIFEEWRDYMFDALPTFTTSYGRYRVTAPKIVAAIDMKDNSKELYQDIWNEYLKPIFSMITEDRDNPKALSDYKVMVKELTNKYLKGDK